MSYESNQILDETGTAIFDESTDSGYALKDETPLSPVAPVIPPSDTTKIIIRVDDGTNTVDLYYH